jgi:hypothetical protein
MQVLLRDRGGNHYRVRVGYAYQVIIAKKGSPGKMETSSSAFTFDGAVSPEIEAFAESIETKHVDPRMTPLQALADITILHALLISGEQNGSVRDITIV